MKLNWFNGYNTYMLGHMRGRWVRVEKVPRHPAKEKYCRAVLRIKNGFPQSSRSKGVEEHVVCGQGTAFYILSYAQVDDVIHIPHMWRAQHMSGWGDSATYHWAWCCKRAHNMTAMAQGRYRGGAGKEQSPDEIAFFEDLKEAKAARKAMEEDEERSPWDLG